MNFDHEISLLSTLADALKKTKDLGEKQELLIAHPRVADFFLQGEKLRELLPQAVDLSSKISLFSIIAIDHCEILFGSPTKSIPKDKIRSLLSDLVAIDRFYECIGGIVGYHVYALKLLAKKRDATPIPQRKFSRALGLDLSQVSDTFKEAMWEGIHRLAEMAEIYPIGGLGSRLNLISKKGEPLPAAFLPFCGRSLLEGLIRDVQGREFLYFRLFNRQITLPIAMMTSLEKQNTSRIRALCEKKGWFGRPQESFMLFPQISVPVITEIGKWSMKGPLELNLQPGGHGALWKAAEERGVFFWLQKGEKSHLLIRQINNPIAGLDSGLLALVGVGSKEKKAFGFASCQRHPHAAEGVLVLVKEEEGVQRLSNIEYTDFKHFGMDDLPLEKGYSLYPANTNILYAHLPQILPVIKKNPLPGLILNMKNREPFFSNGKHMELLGGRLESMMQNISDALLAPEEENLPTFLTYNERKKTISSAKRSFEKGGDLLETPEGAFYDLLQNNYELLSSVCHTQIEPFTSQEDYLREGPSLLFLYHPALGPLYSIIGQKIKGGVFKQYAELQLEIADVILENMHLDGSVLVEARNVLGHNSQGIIRYSQKTGKCHLKNVTVNNKGIHRKATQHYWKNYIKRHQALRILLQGHSEFFAEDVTFEGNHTFIVPDGERWVITQKGASLQLTVEKPQWHWNYRQSNREVIFETSKPF